MLGTIIGDVIGSAYEFKGRTKDYNFNIFPEDAKFTDDTVMMLATLETISYEPAGKRDYTTAYRKWGRAFPTAGYGKFFKEWLEKDELGGIESFGNGSAMRVAPVGWACETLNETFKEANLSAIVSHNHMQGTLGASVVACVIFMARTGATKEEILDWASKYYLLDFTIDEIRPTYKFNATCQGSIPQAIRAFIDSADFESCLRNAISIGGDADTLAAIACSIAEAYSVIHPEYKIPDKFIDFALSKCPDNFKDVLKKAPFKYCDMYKQLKD